MKRRIEQLEASLHEQLAWTAELEKARDWNDAQRVRWMQVAEERADTIAAIEKRLAKGRGRINPKK